MGRYLVLWRSNPVAPWPTDPVEYSKLAEKMWMSIDALIKKGLIKEFGEFLDSTSGYVICEGEATDIFKTAGVFLPYIQFEVHEAIPYEKAKEIDRARLKAQIEAAKV